MKEKINIKEKINQGWIRCVVVIEVLGKPADYIDEVLKTAVGHLEKENYMHIIDKKFYEPKPVENLFSTFTEIEFIIKDFKALLDFIVSYMPSNIEIIEPSDITLSLQDANDFVNRVAVKIHQYDGLLKRVGIENKILIEKLRKTGQLPKEIEEAEKIAEEQIKKMEEEKED